MCTNLVAERPCLFKCKSVQWALTSWSSLLTGHRNTAECDVKQKINTQGNIYGLETHFNSRPPRNVIYVFDLYSRVFKLIDSDC